MKNTDVTLSELDRQLLIGALDSLGKALTDYGHYWTEGERAIFEEALSLLDKGVEWGQEE
jgi:hypothetical protein